MGHMRGRGRTSRGAVCIIGGLAALPLLVAGWGAGATASSETSGDDQRRPSREDFATCLRGHHARLAGEPGDFVLPAPVPPPDGERSERATEGAPPLPPGVAGPPCGPPPEVALREGAPPKLPRAIEAKLRRHAACMRQNGVEVPDPPARGERRRFKVPEVRLDWSRFAAAERKCRQLLPGRRPGRSSPAVIPIGPGGPPPPELAPDGR